MNNVKGRTMFWVNGKDVVFTVSFPMKLGDDILLSPPGLAGGKLRLAAVEVNDGATDAVHQVHHEYVNGESRLSLPFQRVGAFSFEIGSMGNTHDGALSARVVAQAATPEMMIVNFTIYLERKPNFAPR
jgi:hypothetical protein